MPLGTSLADDIQAVFDSQPATLIIAADGLAAAYLNYVQGCTFGASVPVPPLGSTQQNAMAGTLATALALPGIPATPAAAYAAALGVWWAVVPCVGGSGTGNTAGCPGAGAAVAILAAVFANLANTAASAALGIATALQTATLTVVATLTLPPAGPVPTPIS